jgi:hypothetical protein
MGMFRRKDTKTGKLTRQQSMSAVPVLNQLVTYERRADGRLVLHVPRKRTSTVRLVARLFRLPPYKQIELDELGSYAVELCDGHNTVSQIVDRFAGKFQLNRREAEVSMVSYLETLAKRGIIGFAVPHQKSAEARR